jgi:hypothetical protein
MSISNCVFFSFFFPLPAISIDKTCAYFRVSGGQTNGTDRSRNKKEK